MKPSTSFVVWDVNKARCASTGPLSYGAALDLADHWESIYSEPFIVLGAEHVNAVPLRRAPTRGAALYELTV